MKGKIGNSLLIIINRSEIVILKIIIFLLDIKLNIIFIDKSYLYFTNWINIKYIIIWWNWFFILQLNPSTSKISKSVLQMLIIREISPKNMRLNFFREMWEVIKVNF